MEENTQLEALPAIPGGSVEMEFLEREIEFACRQARTAHCYSGIAATIGQDGCVRAGEGNFTEQQLMHIREAFPDHLSWLDISGLAVHDQAEALAKWEEIKAIAREHLAEGFAAAGALSISDRSSPIALACFLAQREALIDSWQPQNAVEQMFIDQLTQLQMLFNSTMSEYLYVSTRQEDEVEDRLRYERNQHRSQERQWSSGKKRWERDQWIPQRMTVAQAIEQAAARMDQVQRMMLRTQRALLSMRRYAPVTIQNAGQVNVATQQVNVAETGRLPKDASDDKQ